MEIITSKNRKSILTGLTIGFVMACAGALWFYLLRYNQLHYYYFVWNTDANAKLPLSESVAHVEYVARHLGKYFLIWLIGMYLILLNLHWSKKRLDSDHRRVGLLEALSSLIAESHINTDWRMVWLAIAPVGMLVLRGAGLNPYVSIPALLGIVLWLINPIVLKQDLFKRKSGLVRLQSIFTPMNHARKINHVTNSNPISVLKSIGATQCVVDCEPIVEPATNLVSTTEVIPPKAEHASSEVWVQLYRGEPTTGDSTSGDASSNDVMQNALESALQIQQLAAKLKINEESLQQREQELESKVSKWNESVLQQQTELETRLSHLEQNASQVRCQQLHLMQLQTDIVERARVFFSRPAVFVAFVAKKLPTL